MVMMGQLLAGMPVSAFANSNRQHQHSPATATPIKHVIVIIGENRTFDHVFATYVPKRGESVSNLLSKGIVRADGSPGPNYSLSAQSSAVNTEEYTLSPGSKEVYSPLPPAMTNGAHTAGSDTAPPPFATLAVATTFETDLFPTYNPSLITGATGLPAKVADTRLPNVNNLREGVFQLTPAIKYDDYTGDPVHRFYQMWQQYDCNANHATRENPSGCKHDLFPWVATTISTGSNGNPQPANFTQLTTGEGSVSMGFYNMQQGDAPYFKYLADHYTLSDNFHQSVMGGTGANHIMFGFADAIWYSDGKGNPAVPPVNQIENPNPQAGTNNYYDQDGYGGGSYSDCSDIGQPGVAPIVNYLQSLPRPIDPHCQKDRYYLLNNYAPGYNADGSLGTGAFTIPPTSVRHIGDALMEKNISFVYYGGHWDRSVAGTPNAYCTICNPFQYATDIMSNATQRTTHNADVTRLHTDIASGYLPAVSIVKPDGIADGHPSSSKLDLFEGFVKKIVTELQDQPDLWKDTAVFVTFDEGGGYYDSGYTQAVDFFGDGTRIPTIVVSPYSRGGKVDHTYYDHVSITKFIEKNWGLKPLTKRSRDNFPNPIASKKNPYVPLNSPALGDMFEAFDFNHCELSHDRF
ncbi:MAG: alkaline phosphatase family protein [Acidobacteria bacterium]|nr:alkaline phosphatase family protein [Acidobacteriota bacterium]